MKFEKSNYFIKVKNMKNLKLIAGLFLLFGIGSTAVYAQDNGIVDVV